MNALPSTSRLRRVLAASLLLCPLLGQIAQAAFDTPDGSFGSGGIAKFTFGTPASNSTLQLPSATVIDPSNRIYVLGSASRSGDGAVVSHGIVRLEANGVIDSTYGASGFTELAPFNYTDGSQLRFRQLALHPDGSHIYLGLMVASSVVIARASLDGSLDETFGNQGIAHFSFSGMFSNTTAGELLAQADGKVIFTGTGTTGVCCNNPSALSYPIAIRLNGDGSADSTFGSAGLAKGSGTQSANQAEATRSFLLSDGRLVVLYRQTGSGSSGWPAYAVATRFSRSGVEELPVRLSSASGYSGFEMGVPKRNSSVVLLSRTRVDGSDVYALNAYDHVGEVDTSFGSNGELPVSLVPLIDVLQTPIPVGGPVLLVGATLDGLPQAAIERISGSPHLAPSLGVPMNLTVAAGDGQVRLTWQASAGATSYQVFQGTTANLESTSPVQSGLGATETTLSGLANGTTYYFAVRAAKSAETSELSSTVSATPQPPIPAPPTDLMASAGDSQVMLTWAAAASAASYNVYQGITPDFAADTPVMTGVTGTGAVIGGLTNGTTYYFVVKAVNVSGTSSASDEASATPLPPIPSAPANLTATAGDTRITLSWSAASNAMSYNVYARDPTGTVSSAPTRTGITGTTTVLLGLTNGQAYSFVVKGVNLAGTGAASNPASATPTAPTPIPPTEDGASENSGGGGASSLFTILILLGLAGCRRNLRSRGRSP